MMTRQGRYGRYIGRLIRLADLIVLNLVFLTVVWLNPGIPDLRLKLTWLLFNIAYIPASFLLATIDKDRPVRMDRVVKVAVQAVVTQYASFLALLYLMGVADLSWKSMSELAIIDMTVFTLWRMMARWTLKQYRSRGGNTRRVAIVGARVTAEKLYEEMKIDPGFGYDVAGFYDIYCPPDFRYADRFRGGLDDLVRDLDELKIESVYYTLSGEDVDTVKRLVTECDRHMARFNYVPQMSSYLTRNMRPQSIGAVPVFRVRTNPLENPVNKALKRGFDLVFSSVVLLLSPIVFIPVAIAVKLSSPGPVFFRQLRTGFMGHDFYCWKFRTMRVNTDADTVQATRTDPRKTKVGEFLRRTSIDELPQFINVFLGDMSVVGPRPHMLKHTEDYSRLLEKYMVRHLIRPGITGWAQIRGYRGQTDELWQMEKRVEHDIWYIEHWNFLLDCKIIFRTFLGVFNPDKNAF